MFSKHFKWQFLRGKQSNKWRTGLDDLAIISQHLKHIRFHHEGMPLIKEINGVGSNIRTLTTFAATNA